jgi:hypothetical protein
MKAEELKIAIKYLGGLFPGQLTQEQARYLAKALAPFTKDAVTQAIDVHRATHTKVDTAHLLEGCRAEERRAKDSTNNTRNEGSWADVHRRMRPQLTGKSDVEVCLRVHRQWIVHSDASYQAKFLASCRQQLLSIGMQREDVPRYVDTLFLDPGSFQQVLDDVRANPPVLHNVAAEAAVPA